MRNHLTRFIVIMFYTLRKISFQILGLLINEIHKKNGVRWMMRKLQNDIFLQMVLRLCCFFFFSETATHLKYFSLVTLMLQNAVFILMMRYVRTRPGDMFMSTTAVIMSEVLKFLACFVIIFYKEGSVRAFLSHLNENIIQQPMDCLKISVPSIIYTVQNNLLFVAVSNLDAAVFQVSVDSNTIWLKYRSLLSVLCALYVEICILIWLIRILHDKHSCHELRSILLMLSVFIAPVVIMHHFVKIGKKIYKRIFFFLQIAD